MSDDQKPNLFVSVAKNYRQWYLEAKPDASNYALSILDPSVLVPILQMMYRRLQKGRWSYLDQMRMGKRSRYFHLADRLFERRGSFELVPENTSGPADQTTTKHPKQWII